VTCFVVSSFWVWKTERDRRIEVEAKMAAAARPYPDWPIRDLFTHIRPDLLTRVDDRVGDTWDEIGNDVRDKAGTGRLKIWGRRLGSALKLLGEREVLGEIDPRYWTSAFFTYKFISEPEADDAPHTYLGSGVTVEDVPSISRSVYADLQVNKAEALAIWPKKGG
jgi:hypothetical protein